MPTPLPLNLAHDDDPSPYVVLDPHCGRLVNLAINPRTGQINKRRVPLAYDEYGHPIWAYNAQGVPVCGSIKGQSPGTYCCRRERDDDGRCPNHRDESNRSRRVKENQLELENNMNGRYGQYMPAALQDDLRRLARSPKLLELDENIAMVDVQLQTLAKSLEGGLDTKSWEKLDAARIEAAVVMATHYQSPAIKLDKLQTIMQKMFGIMESGSKNTKIFDDMARASLIRAKLVETEQRRRKDAQNMIPSDQAYQLFAQVLAIIRRNIRDRHVLEAIAQEVDKLAYSPSNRAILHGSVDLSTFDMSTEATEVLTTPGPDLPDLDQLEKNARRLKRELREEVKNPKALEVSVIPPEDESEEAQLRRLADSLGFDINRLEGVEDED